MKMPSKLWFSRGANASDEEYTGSDARATVTYIPLISFSGKSRVHQEFAVLDSMSSDGEILKIIHTLPGADGLSFAEEFTAIEQDRQDLQRHRATRQTERLAVARWSDADQRPRPEHRQKQGGGTFSLLLLRSAEHRLPLPRKDHIHERAHFHPTLPQHPCPPAHRPTGRHARGGSTHLRTCLDHVNWPPLA